jgi:hypothetical protein
VIIQVTVRAMAHFFSQLSFDGPLISIMPIAGDPLRNTVGDSPGGRKERFRRCPIALLAQQDIDEIAIPIAA